MYVQWVSKQSVYDILCVSNSLLCIPNTFYFVNSLCAGGTRHTNALLRNNT